MADRRMKIRSSVPNPKFAALCSALRANFGFDKDTSNFMILVSFMDQKFARWTRGTDGANFCSTTLAAYRPHQITS